VDCSIEFKFSTEIHHVTVDTLQMFKVKGQTSKSRGQSAKSRSPAGDCWLRRSRSHSAQLSSRMRFDCHAKEVARACNYHTRAMRHARTVLTDDLAETVACNIVASRLDYCNAMLYGAPAATFDALQQAQNKLARVVCQRGGRTDARPLFRSLHWLPVKHRVTTTTTITTTTTLYCTKTQNMCMC